MRLPEMSVTVPLRPARSTCAKQQFAAKTNTNKNRRKGNVKNIRGRLRRTNITIGYRKSVKFLLRMKLLDRCSLLKCIDFYACDHERTNMLFGSYRKLIERSGQRRC